MKFARRLLTTELYAEIRKDIVTGTLKAGDPILSTRQLTDKYKVSPLTVNKAIGKLVGEGLVYRVHGSGTYVSEKMALKPLNIGLAFVLPEGDRNTIDRVYGELRNPASELLKSRNCNIRHIAGSELSYRESFESMLTELDGLIISKWLLDDRISSILKKHKKAVVVVQHEKILTEDLSQVIPDIRNGYAKALAHLESFGSGRLVLTGFEDNRTRKNTFYMCAEDARLSREDIYECMASREIGDLGRLAGRKAAKQIFRNEKNPRIFSTSDFVSFGILDMAAEMGLEPGVDFKLVSYDDLEGQGVLPFEDAILSSVSFPRKEISSAAAKLVLQLIEEGQDNCHIVRVPTELKLRRSSMA